MIASYAWLAGGEIPSQRLRSHTFGLAAAVGFFFAWLTTFTAPYFINPQSLNWGPRYGYIWLPSCIVAAVWVYLFLPEVKGRTLEEIDEMVREKIYIGYWFLLLTCRRPYSLLPNYLLESSGGTSASKTGPRMRKKRSLWGRRSKAWTAVLPEQGLASRMGEHEIRPADSHRHC